VRRHKHAKSFVIARDFMLPRLHQHPIARSFFMEILRPSPRKRLNRASFASASRAPGIKKPGVSAGPCEFLK